MGVIGVFTKQLDIALLNNDADIAVHSLKDVPTQLAENLFLAGVLERGYSADVLLTKNEKALTDISVKTKVATSSLRRKAQWLSKYPHHLVVPIRGNVQTRLKKFQEDEALQGVIFAKAGLDRLNILPKDSITLDWMLPAPAQGIIGFICRNNDEEMIEVCEKINHELSFIAGHIERQFLRTLLGGCSVPISALAEINRNGIEFQGAVHSFDGKQCFAVHQMMQVNEWENSGRISAEKLLEQVGAIELMEFIRNKKWGDEDTFN